MIHMLYAPAKDQTSQLSLSFTSHGALILSSPILSPQAICNTSPLLIHRKLCAFRAQNLIIFRLPPCTILYLFSFKSQSGTSKNFGDQNWVKIGTYHLCQFLIQASCNIFPLILDRFSKTMCVSCTEFNNLSNATLHDFLSLFV